MAANERDCSRLILPPPASHTLFVCTANTCRSPMAETMMSAELARKLKLTPASLPGQGVLIQSAGYYGYKKREITAHTVKVLQEMGYVPPLGRISEELTPELLEHAEIIYAVTRWHVGLILEVNSRVEDKIFLLDGEKDIEDPIGADLDSYRKVGQQIQTAVRQIVDRY